MERIFNRRIFLGGSAVTVGVLMFSGCQDRHVNILLINEDGQFFTASELTILSDITEIMIPSTETPGAIDAQVAPVLDGMMKTWASPSTQAKFRGLIKSFDALARQRFGAPYLKVKLADRRAMIEHMDVAAFAPDPLPEFQAYKHLKEIVFHIYYTSEKGSAEHVPIPGLYSGNLTLAEYEQFIKERAIG